MMLIRFILKTSIFTSYDMLIIDIQRIIKLIDLQYHIIHTSFRGKLVFPLNAGNSVFPLFDSKDQFVRKSIAQQLT